MPVVAAALTVVAAALLAGCTTSASAPKHSDSAAAATAAAGTRTPAAGAPLCPGQTQTAALTACLRDALAAFWTAELSTSVSEPVRIAARPATVPVPCRPGLAAAPAFTCRSDLSLYLNKGMLAAIARDVPAGQRMYAFASVQAHEIGHVLQYRLRQPQIEHAEPTAAQTRYVEQQADCLSGVWAFHAVREHRGFSAGTFLATAERLLTALGSGTEVATHGTPAQRVAAIRRGLATGRPGSCGLTTFR
ncbi:neutral zinc metallopeptidase [uncultured Jatrophihabitans sp.]|uniref:neutral zinc metallopeptidase n=1 Tax=uncultured Jatrophihabitans sp. TaxID=1610747 RepID=UPI0035CA36FC